MTNSAVVALAPVIDALEADGYSALISETADELHFEIVAGPTVCAECLSPRSVIEPMINGLLRSNGMIRRLSLKYPDAISKPS